MADFTIVPRPRIALVTRASRYQPERDALIATATSGEAVDFSGSLPATTNGLRRVRARHQKLLARLGFRLKSTIQGGALVAWCEPTPRTPRRGRPRR